MNVLIVIAILAASIFGRETRSLSINGGDNGQDLMRYDGSLPGGHSATPTYIVMKYQFSGEKEKWVGFFCSSLKDAVKSDPESYALANKAQNLSIASTVAFLPVVPLFFSGINALNASTETASGKHDLSKVSTGSLVLVGSAVGLFITSGVLFAIGKHQVRNVGKTWNKNLKFGIDFQDEENPLALSRVGARLQYGFQ